MKEHPSLPMRGGLLRAQIVGKASASAYASFAFNLYASTGSDTSMMLEEGAYEVQIFELNNITDKNYVRTLLDLDLTADASTGYTGSEVLINSTAVNWNSDADTYYTLRIGDNGTGFGSGVVAGFFEAGNAYELSQAANLAAFDGSLEVVTPNLVTYDVTLGSGHPSRRSGYSENLLTWTFRVTHSNPVWLALDIM